MDQIILLEDGSIEVDTIAQSLAIAMIVQTVIMDLEEIVDDEDFIRAY